MVKAELNVNPYLLETQITFNGQLPKINSRVEKYTGEKLQQWINKLPQIFYDEMNGWDFELDFSGTKVDFEDLQASFETSCGTNECVRLFHKYELTGSRSKCFEFEDLMDWLRSNPNRNFQFEDFCQANARLLEEDYSYIIVQGPSEIPSMEDVTIENVPTFNELEQAALENTPILFYLEEHNRSLFRKDLSIILKRVDIIPQQLFFYISPNLNRAQVERVIRDLGVERPQIVDSTADEVIHRYFEVYPITAYVQQVIQVLNGVRSEIALVLEIKNEQSTKINSVVYEKINQLDEVIRKLKAATELISERNNYIAPIAFSAAREDFVAKVINWRKKKIKMTTEEEAMRVKSEFQVEITRLFAEFLTRVQLAFQAAVREIDKKFLSDYDTADYEDQFQAVRQLKLDLSDFTVPQLGIRLLELRTEQDVPRNDSPFGIFKGVWGTNAAGVTEMVRVVTYHYQDWRNMAEAVVTPILNEVIQYSSDLLSHYYGDIALEYLDHLRSLIAQESDAKERVASQLSEDEQLLQADNDWFAAFQEKLHGIERS